MSIASPMFEKNNICIVFAADDNYAMYLGVCLKSLLEHSSSRYNYDICIMDMGIHNSKKTLLNLIAQGKENVSIRFIDTLKYMDPYKQSMYISRHVTMSTYCRFFLPIVFAKYDKLLYLDCDMLVLRDVAELFSVNIGNNYFGATYDIGNVSGCNRKEEYKNYFYEVLHMENHLNYFQAGCLICNIERMRQDNLTEQLIRKLAEIRMPKYHDQCILNTVCENQVTYIKQNWNYTWYMPKRHPNDYADYIAPHKEQYLKAKADPYIIHFTSIKPWKNPSLEEAWLFWKYARMTPFYEEIIYNNIRTNIMVHYQDLLLAVNFNTIYAKYIKYKIFSRIVFGKIRKLYKAKYLKYKSLVNRVRQFKNS